MRKLFALLLALTMTFALAACGGKNPPSDTDNRLMNDLQDAVVEKDGDSDIQEEESTLARGDESGWFSDEVLAEMKLTGFTLPAEFQIVGDEDLPDAKENDPYYRELTGAGDHEEYKPLIEQVYETLKENYGVVYDKDISFGADGNIVTEYIPMTEVMYGTAFYVKDGDTVRGVDLGYTSGYDADTEVLRINLWPNVEE